MSPRTTLTLANGRGIDLLEPRPEDVDWDSFAEHLAKEKRFNGATPGVEYSVAEHMCRGADAIANTPGPAGNLQATQYFILHDAHEGVLKDLTTPLKRAIAERAEKNFGVLARHILDAINELTDQHDAAIHAAAGLPWPPSEDVCAQVKHWDRIMLVTEWRDLMRAVTHPRPAAFDGIEPLPDRIDPWDWQTAKRALLRRWQRLLPVFNGGDAP